MDAHISFFHYFWAASFIVKLVMLLLLSASFYSWKIIVEQVLYFRWIKESSAQFEHQFSAITSFNDFYKKIKSKNEHNPLETIFLANIQTWFQMKRSTGITLNELADHTRKSSQSTQVAVTDGLEKHISLLATIGSVSPYVGLLGTVWGIMTAFQSLGTVQQATIAMVAPGISEALIATAMGLFAAIPAVIAYNRFIHIIEHYTHRFQPLEDKLIAKLKEEQRKNASISMEEKA
jgi:biopolymer transport protein TolQ